MESSSDDENYNSDDEDEINKIEYIVDSPNIDRCTRYVDDLICIGVSTDPIPSAPFCPHASPADHDPTCIDGPEESAGPKVPMAKKAPPWPAATA